MNESRADAERRLNEQLVRIRHRHSAAAALLDENESLDSTTQVLLRMLARGGPARSSDLAERMALSRPAMSRRLASLARAGLVKSVADPSDGRAAPVSITPAGVARLDALSATGSTAARELVRDFTTQEIETLVSLLSRLNDTAAERLAVRLRKEGHVRSR